MAITQDYDSQTSHITKDGVTVDIYFSMTWTDWANGYDDNWTLPLIGDELSILIPAWSNYDYLRCTDIQTFAINNVRMRASYLYSTDNTAARAARPDQAASWDFEYNTNLELYEGDIYHEVGGSWPTGSPSALTYTVKDWAAVWLTLGGTADNKPPFTRWYPSCELKLYIYGSKFYTQTFQAFTEGVVNSANFLGWLLQQSGTQIPTYEGAEADDSGKWLCKEVLSRQVREGSFNYQFDFIYSSIGWNKVINGAGAAVARSIYHTYDFTTLLKNMNFATPDSNTIRG